jgi:hypothetical protein
MHWALKILRLCQRIGLPLISTIDLSLIMVPSLMRTPSPPGLIQSPAQAFLPGLRAWLEVDGIVSSQCFKAFLLQPISI